MAKYKRQYNADTNKFEDNPNVGKSTPASNTRKRMKAKAAAETAAKAKAPAKSKEAKAKTQEKAPVPRARGDRPKAPVNVRLPNRGQKNPKSREDTGQKKTQSRTVQKGTGPQGRAAPKGRKLRESVDLGITRMKNKGSNLGGVKYGKKK